MSSETQRINGNSANNQIEKPQQILPQQNIPQQNIPQQPIPQQQMNQQQQNLQQPIVGPQVYYTNQVYGYPQAYNQPIIINPNQQNFIINNQASPIIISNYEFTKKPTNIICPYCMHQIKTNVEREFNFCKCFLITGFIFLLPLAILNGGCSCGGCSCDFCGEEEKEEKKEEIDENEKFCDCCYDGIHKCPNCGQTVGKTKFC